MEDFLIQDGIPLPDAVTVVRNPIRKTMRKLLVGQSFLVFATPTKTNDAITKEKRFNAKMGISKQYAYRQDEEEGFCRVWRVK